MISIDWPILAQSAADATLAGATDSAEAADAEAHAGVSIVIGYYMPVFFAAFFVSFIFTPLMRLLATRNGIVDWPDLHRKNHAEPVAYLGGIAIFFGWLAGVASVFYLAPHNGVFTDFTQLLYIVIGALAIVLTGLFDDVYGISPRVKIGGQLFAAAALASQNVGLSLVDQSFNLLHLNPPHWVVYVLGTAVIALFVVGGCNAVNLLDGLDGLASGVTAIAAAGFLVIAAIVATRTADVHQFDTLRLVMCMAIIGGVLGFLPYNFNPASIFMGDAGSLLLGYLCVATILLFSVAGGGSLLLVTAALIVFALPITDTSLAIFRRKMRGQPLFSPDNQHIHHLLRRRGLSVKQAVFVMYGMATLFAILGVTLVALELRWRFLLAVFCVMYAFIFVWAYKAGHKLVLADQQSVLGDEANTDRDEKSESAASASTAVPRTNGNGKHAANTVDLPESPVSSSDRTTFDSDTRSSKA